MGNIEILCFIGILLFGLLSSGYLLHSLMELEEISKQNQPQIICTCYLDDNDTIMQTCSQVNSKQEVNQNEK